MVLLNGPRSIPGKPLVEMGRDQEHLNSRLLTLPITAHTVFVLVAFIEFINDHFYFRL